MYKSEYFQGIMCHNYKDYIKMEGSLSQLDLEM